MIILFLLVQLNWQSVNKPISDSLQELIIYFTIPNQELKFISEDSLFYASYESRIKVYDKGGNQLTGDFWQTRRSKDSLNIRDSVNITIPKTADHFSFKILDIYGGEIFSISEKIIPINYIGNIRWQLYGDTLNVSFTILNQKEIIDSIIYSMDVIRRNIQAEGGIYDDSLAFTVEEFLVDKYESKFEVFSKDRRIEKLVVPIRISRSFFLDESLWSVKVEQLEYIATPSEMRKLEKADIDQRDSLWHAFWKEHDPTPNTKYNEKEKEYFDRIQYCEENFTHGDRGWRSDRAKIYVKYGKPDEIQSRPYELNSQPYEIWLYYRLNRKYIFHDPHGFGQYYLVNPGGSSI
jgi:GWxTD domain-containing protein